MPFHVYVFASKVSDYINYNAGYAYLVFGLSVMSAVKQWTFTVSLCHPKKCCCDKSVTKPPTLSSIDRIYRWVVQICICFGICYSGVTLQMPVGIWIRNQNKNVLSESFLDRRDAGVGFSVCYFVSDVFAPRVRLWKDTFTSCLKKCCTCSVPNAAVSRILYETVHYFGNCGICLWILSLYKMGPSRIIFSLSHKLMSKPFFWIIFILQLISIWKH